MRTDASISATLVPGSEARFNTDGVWCLRLLGVDLDGLPEGPVLRRAFSAEVAGAECLRIAGWPISTDPSYETLAETCLSAVWFPWAEIDPGDSTEAFKICPPPTPDE